MYYQRKIWRNILTLIFVLLLLTNGVVWVHHADRASAIGVSPKAVTVYGQGGIFTSSTANNGGASTTSLSGSRDVAFDSSGNLYVADYTNNRVLYYAAGSTTATRVYGQGGSFSTTVVNNNGSGVTGTPSANNLNGPTGLALDSSGNLYVADDGNNRVLYYAAASTTATRVYGQGGSYASNTGNNGGTSTTSLNQPNGVALDSSGNLYVADWYNNRVLYYASGSIIATRVYGQNNNYTTGLLNNTSGTANTVSATSIANPLGVVLDSSGTLYVADSGNNRVLSYPTGNLTASVVYGQNGSFSSNSINNTSGTPNTVSATSLYNPTGLALDSNNNLYVTDDNNNRVLYYPSGTTTAARVYGQAGSLTSNSSNNGGTTATSLAQPFNATINSSGNLYVADSSNNRVLQFQTSLSITTQPAASSPGTFSAAASLIDVGSGATFSDFSGTVSAAIKAGTGAPGAILTGTPVSASSGVATFSSLYINLPGSGYILTFSNPGVGSANTTSFAITNALGPQAVTVYGQSGSFTTNVSTALHAPKNSVTDSSGDLYVADTPDHRVLYYAAGSTTATIVYGQFGSPTTTYKDNTNTGSPSSTASSGNLWNPFDVALDSSGDLYVVDTGNNRVLYYPAGTTTPFLATRVYGQSGSMITNVVNNNGSGVTGTPTADNLDNPLSVALDSSGNLYISDNGNDRVLYYPAGTTTATAVYGQNGSLTSNLINNTGGIANTVSATSLSQPVGIGLDSNNNLYVVDNANTRVLYYPSGNTTATRVYGQAGSFSSVLVNNTGGIANTVSATSLSNPSSIATDSANNLYVADTSNRRVLYYPSGSTTPTRVYGQAGSFTTTPANNTSGTSGVISANSLYNPYGVNLDSHGDIYVADASNNRMLEFQTALSITTQPPSIVATGTAFSTVAALIDVGSGATFPDFSGTVAVTIASGTGGAVLSGTTSVSASSGVATFSNLAINLTGASYTLTLSSSGTNSATTSAFGVLNPAGYWHFDENTGTTAHDTSGNANHGTLSGSLPTWTSGKINSGLSFSGNSYVNINMGAAPPAALQFGTGSFSVIGWFKTTNTGHQRIVAEGNWSYSNGFLFGFDPIGDCNGCLGGSVGGGGGGTGNGTLINTLMFESTTGAGTFDDGNWHQGAMVINQTADTAQIYVDGVAMAVKTQSGSCGAVSGTSVNLVASPSCAGINATATSGTTNFTISSASGNAEYFNGNLDEIRVYNSALSSSQIQTLYTNDVSALSEYAANATFSGTVGSTATYTLPIALTYQLAPAPGWSITITSMTLKSGANTLPTTASTITSVTGTCASSGTCLGGVGGNTLTNTISSFPITLPAGTTAPTAVKFFGTIAGTGQGAYTVTPTFSVTIPATAKPGSYTSTVTLMAAVGP